MTNQCLSEAHEFELGAIMAGAVRDENYELCAMVRDEVERRVVDGTLNMVLAASIIESTKSENGRLARLAFVRG